MNALLDQLGINGGLFLSQAVNFFILLLVLTFFVYKPLIKVVKTRNAKIKEGLEKAEEADIRLKEVDNIGKEKIKQAEQESINIIKSTEQKAKVLGAMRYDSHFNYIIEKPGGGFTFDQLKVNVLKEFNKGLELAGRQLNADIILLKELKQPRVSIKVKTDNAYLAQNQQININSEKDENIESK